jgi:ABC-type multidrug transport system ATPase subunit
VSALSGGLKQRLALAIALLADPPLLLLDEPTANLDTDTRADYLALLASLRHEGKLIIFASHRIEEVESLADRVLVLQHGSLVDTLTPEALRVKWLPAIEMTIWVKEEQRAQALQCLLAEGLEAHLNGRGTVVARVKAAQKMRPIYALNEQGIKVINFEMERVTKIA